LNILNFLPIQGYSLFFSSLNKWPIDKAPKVSNSSYLVGLGFIFLFHLYAYPILDNFSLFSYSWLTFEVQFLALFTFLFIYLFFYYRSITFIFFIALTLFIFLFSPRTLLHSKYYRYSNTLYFNYLVINWDFFLFFFFFVGWIFKVYKRYFLESYTMQESFFYKTALPSIYIFEFFTFVLLIIWRYLNTGLMGYSTIMYIKYYRYHYITSLLFIKLIFFIFTYTFFFFLLTLLKEGQRLLFFFFFIFSYFMYKEFNEFWSFIHTVAPSNLLKFTYYKFFFYILFFNFLHVYLVAGLTLLCFLLLLARLYSSYSEFYDILYINIKNFYLIMWLTVALFASIYFIHDLHFYFFL